MNLTDEKNANRVWEMTLPEIRNTRRRRGQRRVALAAIASCLLFGTSWLLLKPSPMVHETLTFAPPVSEIEETIAVMRVDEEGRFRLEELPVSDFGSIELAFGLTQLMSDDLPD